MIDLLKARRQGRSFQLHRLGEWDFRCFFSFPTSFDKPFKPNERKPSKFWHVFMQLINSLVFHVSGYGSATNPAKQWIKPSHLRSPNKNDGISSRMALGVGPAGIWTTVGLEVLSNGEKWENHKELRFETMVIEEYVEGSPKRTCQFLGKIRVELFPRGHLNLTVLGSETT